MEIYFKRNKLIDPYILNLKLFFLLFFINFFLIFLLLFYLKFYIYLLILFTAPENLPTSSPIFDCPPENPPPL